MVKKDPKTGRPVTPLLTADAVITTEDGKLVLINRKYPPRVGFARRIRGSRGNRGGMLQKGGKGRN